MLKDANPLVQASIRRQQTTHPLPVKRGELEKWFESDEYEASVGGRWLQLKEPLQKAFEMLQNLLDS